MRDNDLPADTIITQPDAIPEVLKQDFDWLVILVSPNSKEVTTPIAPNHGRDWAVESRKLFDFETAYEKATEIVRSPQVDTDLGERVALAYRFTTNNPYVDIVVENIKDLRSTRMDHLIDLLSYGYVEHSITSGFHTIVRACAEDVSGEKQRFSDEWDTTVEAYGRNRYSVFTGDAITTSEIEGYAQDELDSIFEGIQENRKEQGSDPVQSIENCFAQKYEFSNYFRELPQKTYAPDAIWTAIHYDDEFEEMYTGSTEGYRNQSEADTAFAKKLAFWCRGDMALMGECFRQSAYYNFRSLRGPDWDGDFRLGGTYGERTLRRAKETTTERYNGAYLSPPCDSSSC